MKPVLSKNGLALDIDETLSATNLYWIEHLQKRFGNPETLTPREIVRKYHYTQYVPYWQSEEALAWMENARNSNEVQELLPLISNANHIVGKINSIIPIAAYITVRPESVINGTKKWLAKHNFPDAPVIARPAGMDHKDGNKWKANLLHSLFPKICGIVDDNPSVADHLPSDYQGTVFLYDNLEHARKDVRVIPCEQWEDVLEAVSTVFGRTYHTMAPKR